jgi:hypothetical protein
MNPTPELFQFGDLERQERHTGGNRVTGLADRFPELFSDADLENHSLYILESHEYEQNGPSWV